MRYIHATRRLIGGLNIEEDGILNRLASLAHDLIVRLVGRATVASKRQQEIVDALDITKNQASATVTDEQESNVETVDTAGRESVPSKWSRVAAVKV